MMNRRWARWTVLAALATTGMPVALNAAAVNGDDLTKEKTRTDRTIRVEAVVNAAPNDVYELWVTENGVKSFFAPACRIEPRVGGAYEMIFRPDEDPTGAEFGTRGARLLAMEPGKRIAFEWRGKPEMKEMSATPLPTWVEVEFQAVPGNARQTHVVLSHFGFGKGGGWEAGYEYFDKTAWPSVLEQLKRRYEAGNDGETPVYYAVIVRRGSNWKPPSEWDPRKLDQHMEHMNGLQASGRIVMAGPFMDNEGGLTVLRADSAEQARELMSRDVLVTDGVLELEIHPWRVVMRSK